MAEILMNVTEALFSGMDPEQGPQDFELRIFLTVQRRNAPRILLPILI